MTMCMRCQARFLLAKLNPSATHQTDQGLASEVIFTEDVSLEAGPRIVCFSCVSMPVGSILHDCSSPVGLLCFIFLL